MSAPLIWIVTPGIIAGLLYIARRWRGAINLIGFSVALILALIAWLVPVGDTISLSGLPPIKIDDTLFILGRQFVIEDASRSILMLIYLGVAFWFGGASISDSNRLFVPVGLGMAALLTAAIAVEPFIFAALLIEITALISILILAPPGSSSHRGALRFLTFQTIGMALILIAGWFLTGAERNQEDAELILRAAALVGLGFALIMAIFPFHSWILLLTEETHLYAAAFVFFIFPQAVSLFLLSFLVRFTWISATATVFATLRIMGMLMVLIGGIWSAFQSHLGRIMGYAAIMEIGFSLLALSILDPGYANDSGENIYGINLSTPFLGIFFAQFLPRLIGLAVWALALVIIRSKAGSLNFEKVRGVGYSLPIASVSIVMATFSIAGLPLLAGFPVRGSLWTALVDQSIIPAMITLVGISGLLFAGFRTLAILIDNPDPQGWQITEERPQIVLLIVGWIILILMGILPQTFLPSLTEITNIFGTTSP